MSYSISQIVRMRSLALQTQFVQGIAPIVEMDDSEALRGVLHLSDFRQGDSVVPLGRRRQKNVVMVGSSAHPEAASVWVSATYGDYRAAYRAFLQSAYGVHVTDADLEPYDVDHLLNRARAGTGNSLLRIEALPRASNRQWGGYLEKMASVSQVAGNRKTRRLMSYLIVGKLAGFAPPLSLTDEPSLQRLARQISELGLPLSEVQEGLEQMLGHINNNLP